MVINIAGLEKHKVLMALYDNAKPLGMGVLNYDPKPMSEDEAKELLESSKDKYFDYIKGIPIKISLADDMIETHLYDRDNLSAIDVIEKLKETEGISGMNTAMVFEDEKALQNKRKIWDDIFMSSPDLSDRIIAIKNDIGFDGLKLLNDFIVDGFNEYFKSCTSDSKE